MPLRLLLDENLSERPVSALKQRFPDSSHVRALSLGGADDTAIWDCARNESFVLVTKDEDFIALSVMRGTPPKVVWLNIGNAGNQEIAALLLLNADAIEQFADHSEASFLALTFGRRSD